MRIDVKRVKGKEYLQLAEGRHVFHVGAATDFDSWLVAYLVWEKHWRQEYLRKRQKMLDKVELNVKERIVTDNLELQVFEKISRRDQFDFRVLPQKSLQVPRLRIYGSYNEIDNPDPQYYSLTWTFNDRGQNIRKRLKDIGFKERGIKQKESTKKASPRKTNERTKER